MQRSATSPEECAVDIGREICGNLESAESREWLVTNGIGGFASGTVAGSLTRRYHGLLIAALEPPVGRTLMATKIDETVQHGERSTDLGTNRWASGAVEPQGYRVIERFRLEGSTPVWTFAIDDALLEKRVWMEHGCNTSYVEYRLVRAFRPLHLQLRMLVNYRDFHGTTHAGAWRMQVDEVDRAVRVVAFDGAMPLWIDTDSGSLRREDAWYRDFALRREAERGLEAVEDHLCAAELDADLVHPGERLTVVFSAGARATIDSDSLARNRERARGLVENARAVLSPAAPVPRWIEQLVVAADQFVVTRPVATNRDAASLIAGYHWFGDWGRDTMIALPGIALAVGRAPLAENVLRTFAPFVVDGLLPNYFPDAGATPEYNSVDAALWFVEAVRRYDEATGDTKLARDLFPSLLSIVDAYERGTRYHIGVDAADGLLFAGEAGVQLTWMDAKVGDWVVTPRIGKPIEVNALWYSALRTLEAIALRLGENVAGKRFMRLAAHAAEGFGRFWDEGSGWCFDVLDGPEGNDPSFRPNQLIAASLAYTPLDVARRRSIVAACGERLLTSYGLRSLDPGDRHYRGRYGGTVSERDGAYHQGTVWGWLIGPWIAAHLRCGTRPEIARSFLEPYRHHLQRYGLGTLAEIADGDAPFAPNGCIAQAWTVAHVLDAWRATEGA